MPASAYGDGVRVIAVPDGTVLERVPGEGPEEARPWAVPAVDLAVLKGARIAEAWAECERRCESEAVTVTTSAGTYAYGIDAATRSNLQMATIGLLAGIQPFPRPWTPKGAAAIAITADDLKLIAGSVGAAYDARVQAYLAHKGAIKELTTATAIAAHDLSAGWPE